MAELTKKWWKETVVYQIYPRSFMDANGDGMGDLPGVISKLDYLSELGVDVLWICPMYKSPQDDNGYDVSDYQDIHHEFGTMADFDRLLDETHKRGMKLIIDLVINHTSDEHPWFIESRSSRDNPKRDWYIWRDGKDGREPNNWESIFGGSAWEYDAKTEQYYMHLFSRKQPDLNWENLGMREAVYRMMRWWMDKGIDGFRIDAISHMRKEPGLADMPNPTGLEYVSSFAKHMNIEGIQDYLADICKNTFSLYDIMTVGEANGVSAERAEEWVHERHNKLNMIIQFEHIGLWSLDPEKRVDVPNLKRVFTRWQHALEGKGWNALFVENHDIPRVVSKWGDAERHWKESCTSIATMYFLMQGTPFIYQGQELGMTNTVFESPEDFNDVIAKNFFKTKRKEGLSDAEIIRELAPGSRDNSRTPMQWDASENAGFSRGRPWMKVNPNYKVINAEAQLRDPDSVFHYYRKLIRLRKADPALWVYGHYELSMADSPEIYAYTREAADGRKALVIANLKNQDVTFEDPSLKRGELLLANLPVTGEEDSSGLRLRPFEARVYQVV